MDINALLKEMSSEEKIRTMETIWDDLCREADRITSPSWHRDVLHEREEQVKEGSASFIDWEKAKKDIRDTVS